jgi:pimeloyl-ACP methyl ester carboxylesterase
LGYEREAGKNAYLEDGAPHFHKRAGETPLAVRLHNPYLHREVSSDYPSKPIINSTSRHSWHSLLKLYSNCFKKRVAMKATVKLLILLIAAGIVYSLESFTCKNEREADSSVFKTKEGEKLYLEAYEKTMTLWPVKYEEVDLETDFGKAHVTTSGPERGSPLVLMHGMNASSTMWYPNIKDLSAEYRVYAIDFIAEPGKSVRKKEIKTKEDIVNWYSEVFNKLGLKQFDIVGASRGGWMSILLSLETEFKINKIILLSPAQTFVMVKPKPEVIKNAYFVFAPERKKLRSTLKTMTYDVDKINKLYIEQYYVCMENIKKETEFLKMDVFSDEELKKLKPSVFLMIGDNDIINNKECLERAEKNIPKIESQIVNKAGHFLNIDQAEKVNEEMLRFLKK